MNVAVLSVKIGDDRYLVDELRDTQPLAPLYSGAKPDLGQRAVDEVAESHQAPAEHHSRAAVDGDSSMSQRLKREKRGIEQVAKFVRHLPQPLSLLRPSSLRREAGPALSTLPRWPRRGSDSACGILLWQSAHSDRGRAR